VGITSKSSATFTAGGQTITPTVINDYIALSRRLAPTIEVKASDLVFVGYGVVALNLAGTISRMWMCAAKRSSC